MENNEENPTVTAQLLEQKHRKSESRRKEMKWALSDKEKLQELVTLKR